MSTRQEFDPEAVMSPWHCRKGAWVSQGPEGRALHDRQGTPWLHRGLSPFGHRLWPDGWVGMPFTSAQMGLGIRPTYLHGRAERIPPQNRALACLGIVPVRQTRLGLAPPRRVGLCTTAKEHFGSTAAFPHLATGSGLTASHGHPPHDRKKPAWAWNPRIFTA